jgi:hypothetical protein
MIPHNYGVLATNKDLDCHVAAEDLVFGLKYLTHPTFAQIACDSIMSERLAEHKEALHIDSRCNAMKSNSIWGLI